MRSEVIWPSFKYAIWSIPLTVLFILPSTVDPINLPKLLVLLGCAITSTLLFVSLRKYQAISKLSGEKVLYFSLYSALIITMLVSGVMASENWVRFLLGAPGRNNGLVYYFSAILIAVLILLSSVKNSEVDYLSKVLLITSLIFAAYCTLQYLNLDPIGWSNPFNRIIGTLGNPNFSSAALSTFSVLWVVLIFNNLQFTLWRKVLSALASSLMMFLAWSTDSLQGLVIIALGVGIVLYVELRRRIFSKWLPWISLFGGALIFAFLFASFIGLGPLGVSLEQYTLRLRANYAAIGFKAMLESPFFGIGVGNYNSAFRLYRTPEFLNRYGVGLNADNAHSTPAHIGASFVLIVFLLYLVLHFFILLRALKIINSRQESHRYLQGIAIVWILIFAQSLLSIEIIGLGVMNWILGAILLSSEVTLFKNSSAITSKVLQIRSQKRLPEWVGMATIVSIVLSVLPFIYFAREDTAYKNLLTQQIQGPGDSEWVLSQLKQLSNITFLEPTKVARISDSLNRAGLTNELGTIIKDTYKVNKSSITANELMVAYYRSVSNLEKEIEHQELLREIDPINYIFELALARNYAANKDLVNLSLSASRIQDIAPNSEEAKIVAQLYQDTKANR